MNTTPSNDAASALPRPPLRRLLQWKWTAAFVFSCGLAGGLLNVVYTDFWQSVAILLVPCALLFGMIGEARRNAVAKGCATRASGRYQRRMLLWTPGYILAIFGAIWVFRHLVIAGPLLWALGVLPAVPVLGIIWSMGRYAIEEDDEYQRAQFVVAALVATGVLLSVATVWGFLEIFGLAPHVEAYVAFPIWALGLGIGQCINRWRGR